jgi:hypothetical protein
VFIGRKYGAVEGVVTACLPFTVVIKCPWTSMFPVVLELVSSTDLFPEWEDLKYIKRN